MTSLSGFVQLLAVKKGFRFRDNYGESGGDCKIKRSRTTINATSKRISKRVEIFAVIMHNLP